MDFLSSLSQLFKQYPTYSLIFAFAALYFYHIFKVSQINKRLRAEIDKSYHYKDMVNEFSKEKFSVEKTQHFAFYDVLTDLPNRFLFENRLKHLLIKAEREKLQFPVIFLNLDRFKAINDSLGHKKGDLLLKQVANRLLGCVRESDTVAHMGSDEFTMIFEAVYTREDAIRFATRIAQSILNEMSRPFELNDAETYISISIGIVFYPDDGQDVEELLKNADTAMQHAKGEGNNRYSFYESRMNTAAKKRRQMENEMRAGIENGEFCLHFQPLMNLRTDEIESAEALLRWEHPKRGSVPRNEFIPLAEETGLIVPLGEWVIAEAMGQAKEWIGKGLTGFRITINVSLHQAQQNELLPFIKRMLDEIRVPPEFIAIELTETVFMANMDRIKTLLSQLSEIGISLVIDDFGTGYSSLSRLRDLPATTVKIDQSFVRDLTISADNANLIKAIIAMAHSLRMKVVAEGIETQGQMIFLKDHLCDMGQGYLIGRPVSVTEFEALLIEKGLIQAGSPPIE